MIRIGQAIFGELNRGHKLLAASPTAKIAPNIVGRMDRPGTVPSGTNWLPYVSGFAYGSHYVLARTAPDLEAERAGMVFSRAFILSLSDAAECENIAGLFVELEMRGNARNNIEDIEWQGGSAQTPSSIPLVEALLTEGEGPVVWPKQEGFEEAIAGLWRNLWPEARRTFSFGLAFRPQDLPASPPLVVAVPAAITGRWSDFRQARTALPALDASAALLVGDSAGEPLRKLMGKLEAPISDFSDLSQLTVISATFDPDADFGELVAALRAAAYLSPDPEKGSSLKNTLLVQAIDAMNHTGADEVLMARNLDLSAFEEASTFWKGLASWAKSELWSTFYPELTARIVRSAYGGAGPVEHWKAAIKKGFEAALRAPEDNVIDGAWRLIVGASELLPTLLSQAHRIDAFEEKLIKRAPLS